MALFRKKPKGKIEIFKAQNGEFYFRIIAENGEPIAISEGYKQKEMCKKGIVSVRKNVNSDIIDLTV